MPEETPDLYGAYPRLEEYQLVELAAVGERRAVGKGETLQRAGEAADEFLVVLEGHVVVVHDVGLERRVIAVHGPRRFLGDLGLLIGQPLFLTSVTEDAALNPDTEDQFLYFLAKKDGSNGTVFAKTSAEHEQNIAKYGN